MTRGLTITLGAALGSIAALVGALGGLWLGLSLTAASLLALALFAAIWLSANLLVRIPIEKLDGQDLTHEINSKSRISEIVALTNALEGVRRRYLRSSQIRKNVLHAMSDGLQILDSAGATIEVNPALCELVGIERAQFLSHSDPFFYLDDAAKEQAFHFLEVARAGECQPRSSFDAELKAKDGSISKLSMRMGCVRLESEQDYCITAMLIDMASDRAADISFSEINQMRMLGKFAAGIAHNMNNLLTSTLSAISVLEGKLALPDRNLQTRMAAVIRQATEKAALLTQELLQMARIREGRLGRRPTDVAKILSEVVTVSMSLKNSTQYEFIFNKPVAPVLALSDESGLHQVLLNLVTNALDAMPDGGKIELAIASASTHAGSSVAILVKDNGAGMTPAVRARIFEPFFTTKDAAANKTLGGSGLGLSSARALIDSWGGAIECESIVGSGTTFTVYLQAVAAAQALEVIF